MVEELAKFEGKEDSVASLSKKDLCKYAMECKQIYEVELRGLDEDSERKKKKPKSDEQKRENRRTESIAGAAAGYDSDETIEMTEEEIGHAFNTVSSKIYEN